MLLNERNSVLFTLGGCGGLEKKPDFGRFLFGEGVVILEGLIFNNFYYGKLWVCLGAYTNNVKCMCNSVCGHIID